MHGALFHSSDLVATSLAAAMVGSFALAALSALGLSWMSERWRVPVALSATALLATGLVYYQSLGIWTAKAELTAAPRYIAWYTAHPLIVAAVYFFANAVNPVPIGIFWRTTAAAILMVFCRHMGDADIFDPTLGVLLSIAFWLYILGEFYFGHMADAVREASRPIRLGYFWIRLLMTIGWVILPILHFVDVVIGTGHVRGIVVLYTVGDLVNLFAISLILLSVAGKERY